MTLITREDRAPAAGVEVRRRGAQTFRGNDDGHAGYLRLNWAPVNSIDGYEFEVTVLGLGVGNVIGRAGAFYAHVEHTSAGNLRLWVDGAVRVDAPVSIGVANTIRVRVTRDEQSLWLDGTLLGTSTATVNMNVFPDPWYVGNAAGNDFGARGVFRDLTITDLNTASNSATFTLDAPKAGGGYANSLAGSSVPDIVAIGTVLPVLINAPGGDGVPVYSAPVVVCIRSDSATSGTTDFYPTFSTGVDLNGWRNGNFISPPVVHSGTYHATGRIRATALAGSAEIQVLIRAGSSTEAAQPLTLDTVNKWVSFSLHARLVDVVGNNNQNLRIASVTGSGATIETDDVYLTAIITPSTTTS